MNFGIDFFDLGVDVDEVVFVSILFEGLVLFVEVMVWIVLLGVIVI